MSKYLLYVELLVGTIDTSPRNMLRQYNLLLLKFFFESHITSNFKHHCRVGVYQPTSCNMTGYTLHAPAGSFRAFKILIAAEYNGIEIDIPEFDASVATALSPTGKAPVLQTPSGGVIFESHSIARYIARMRRDIGLTGNGSIVEEAAVDSWCDFCANNLELPACVWWYPVAGYMDFQQAA